MEPGFADTLYFQLLESHERNAHDRRNAIRDFRVVFEQVFRKLTEGEPQVFSNVFQRVVFVIDKYEAPEGLRDEMHGFRLFGNKVTHEPATVVIERNYLTSLRAVCLTIAHFSHVPVPDRLLELYGSVPGLTFSSRTYRRVESVPLVKCVVKGKGDLETRPDGRMQFLLNCEDEGELGLFKLVVRPDDRNLFRPLYAMLREYTTLNLLHIVKDPGQEGTYLTGSETRIVLEPDFLVDASDIAECFQNNGPNPLLYFLGKLVDSEAGIPAFKGKLVNEYLDALINSPGKTSDEVFREALEAHALKAARFGAFAMEQIRSEIRTGHFPTLQRMPELLAGKKVRIEPTFFSPLYGLQGRLDVLTEDLANPSRKDIFELKSSSRFPPNSQWMNHQVQVVCYNMLLYSVYGPGRSGNSSVLYSANGSNPLWNVASTIHDEWKVLSVRNQIVDGLFLLAGKDYALLDLINAHDFGPVPVYKRDDIGAFEGAYHRARELEQKYYRAMLSFVLKEHQVAKIGSDLSGGREDSGFSALWQESLEEKKNKYNVLAGLSYRRFDAVENCAEFGLDDPGLNHNFREGDLGIVYPDDGAAPDPVKCQILKGSIRAMGDGRLVFALRNRQLDETFFSAHPRWIIEHDLFESNTWSVVQSLLRFLQAPARLRDLVLGRQRPEFAELRDVSVKDFTGNQHRLLNQALRAKDYFLMQGPPGTGKTSTMMVQVTRQIVERTESRIVILAFTNRAVEEICNKLRAEGVAFLRLGGRNSNDEEALQGIVGGLDAGAIRNLILSHRVFVSTVSSFHTRKSDLFGIAPPEVLIIDEASQLTEPMVAGLLSGFRKFILIGDQKQLPAVIAQHEDGCRIEDETLRSAGIVDLRQSLFERLYQLCEQNGWSEATGMLEQHYRMHDHIAGLVNHYYDGKLVSAKPGQQELLMSDMYDIRTNDPVVRLLSRSRTLFIQSGYLPTAKRHEEEARKVVTILKTLRQVYGDRFDNRTVGVVTPWRAQIAQIRSLIDDAELREKVTVDTIERFQGSERDIIIVSLAIYHRNQLVPLQSVDLRDTVDRKLLVTVSRAKEQLIMLGYDPPLEGSRYYRDLLEKIRANGGMVSYLEGMKSLEGI